MENDVREADVSFDNQIIDSEEFDNQSYEGNIFDQGEERVNEIRIN